MKVLAPGKLILSGEHAVVYGKPAIALAVNRYVTATVLPQNTPQVSFDLSDLGCSNDFSFSSFKQLKDRIKKNYHDFLQGNLNIREVLQTPYELAQYVLSLCLEMLNVQLSRGIRIHVKSNIPIGCGMGSSAATILSILYAFKEHFALTLMHDDLMRLALEAENAQHGISSGLDLHVSLNGGSLYRKNNMIQSRSYGNFGTMYLVNTGTPKSTTGECVSQAKPHFLESSIGDDFATITDALDVLLLSQAPTKNFQSLIKANHQLLVKIGVVPMKVQQFISEIETCEGAAKICGAGAVFGDNAGVLLVVIDDISILREICLSYGYEILPLAIENRGVRVV